MERSVYELLSIFFFQLSRGISWEVKLALVAFSKISLQKSISKPAFCQTHFLQEACSQLILNFLPFELK